MCISLSLVMNHLSSSKNNVWPCVLGGVAVGAAGALALAHAWRPASCRPQEEEEEEKKKVPRRGLGGRRAWLWRI